MDESRWPLVVFTASGEQTEADFDAYLADGDVLLRRRETHGIVFDARRAAPISPKLRKRQVDWLDANHRLLETYRVASGMVMASAVQRGVFRAICWMKPLPFPYTVESSLDAASRFVCLHLSARGCAVPPVVNWAGALARRGSGSRNVHPR
jgi:hypothetical protein